MRSHKIWDAVSVLSNLSLKSGESWVSCFHSGSGHILKCWLPCLMFCSNARPLLICQTLCTWCGVYVGITDSNNCQKGNASCKSCPHVIWTSSDLSASSHSLENAWKKSFLEWPQQKVSSMNLKIYVSLIRQCTQLLHTCLTFQELRPMDWVHLKINGKQLGTGHPPGASMAKSMPRELCTRIRQLKT